MAAKRHKKSKNSVKFINRMFQGFLAKINLFLASKFLRYAFISFGIITRIIYYLLLIAVVGWLFSQLNWNFLKANADFQLFLEYIKVLVWPLIALITMALFGNEVRGILQRGFKLWLGDGRGAEIPAKNQDTSNIQPIEKLAEEAAENQDSRQLTHASQDDNAPTSEEIAEKFYNEPVVQLSFERTYRNIFGTQVELLQHLESFQNGLTPDGLQEFYEKHLKLLPSTANPWSFLTYMRYLIASGLVNHDPTSGIFTIAFAGIQFNRYLREQNIADPTLKSL